MDTNSTQSKFLYTKLHGPSQRKFEILVILAQWLKSSDDVITKVMKTDSSNHIQTCSQLLKAHLVFVEWVFWHIIKVNITKTNVFNKAFKAVHPTKNRIAGSVQLCIEKLCTQFDKMTKSWIRFKWGVVGDRKKLCHSKCLSFSPMEIGEREHSTKLKPFSFFNF